MRIGEVAQRTGLSISNIRFYEKKGLIGPERNEQNRYREYEEEDVQQAMELQIDHLEEQKQKLQGSIDLCRKIVSDQAFEDLDVAYYMNYVKEEESAGRKFAEIDVFLEDFSECTKLELLLNDMGRMKLFANPRVRMAIRFLWCAYLVLFPVVTIGLSCVGVTEWSVSRVLFCIFWLILLIEKLRVAFLIKYSSL